MKFLDTLLLVCAVIAGPVEECPTAKRGEPNLFTYRTTSFIQKVVWTADGKKVLGSEAFYEHKRSWDPLVGTTLQRKRCHQFFLANEDGSERQNIGPMKPLQTGGLFAYLDQGYILSQTFGDQIWYYQLNSIKDGSLIANLPEIKGFGEVLPSPKGDLIAHLTYVQDPNGAATTSTIRFYNPKGQVVGVPTIINNDLALFVSTWTNQNEFVLSDRVKAFTVSSNGTSVQRVLPRCETPQTTSSEVNGEGKVLGVTSVDKFGVVERVDPSRIFGCQ